MSYIICKGTRYHSKVDVHPDYQLLIRPTYRARFHSATPSHARNTAVSDLRSKVGYTSFDQIITIYNKTRRGVQWVGLVQYV